MSRLVRAELLKVRSTPSSWWMSLAALALVAFATGLTLALKKTHSGDDVRSLLSFAGTGGLIVLIMGVAIGTAEYRHRSLLATLIAEPRRIQVWVAQCTALLVVGAIVGLACVALSAAIVFPWLAAKGIAVGVSSRQLAAGFVGSLAYGALSAPLGLAIGSLARNQVAAVSVVFIGLAVVDPTISELLPGAGRFGPSAIGVAMTGGVGSNNGPFESILTIQGASLVYVLTTVVLAVAGGVVLARRDLK